MAPQFFHCFKVQDCAGGNRGQNFFFNLFVCLFLPATKCHASYLQVIWHIKIWRIAVIWATQCLAHIFPPTHKNMVSFFTSFIKSHFTVRLEMRNSYKKISSSPHRSKCVHDKHIYQWKHVNLPSWTYILLVVLMYFWNI